MIGRVGAGDQVPAPFSRSQALQQRVLRGSGTAVENQQGELAWLFAVSDHAVPCAITAKGNEAFGCRELLHFSPSFCISLLACISFLWLREQFYFKRMVLVDAAANCVCASLWKVVDCQTTEMLNDVGVMGLQDVPCAVDMLVVAGADVEYVMAFFYFVGVERVIIAFV